MFWNKGLTYKSRWGKVAIARKLGVVDTDNGRLKNHGGRRNGRKRERPAVTEYEQMCRDWSRVGRELVDQTRMNLGLREMGKMGEGDGVVRVGGCPPPVTMREAMERTMRLKSIEK